MLLRVRPWGTRVSVKHCAVLETEPVIKWGLVGRNDIAGGGQHAPAASSGLGSNDLVRTPVLSLHSSVTPSSPCLALHTAKMVAIS